MRRPFTWTIYAAGAVVFLLVGGCLYLTGRPWWAGLELAISAIYVALAVSQWKEDHGSNRKPEEDPQDPNPNPFTVTFKTGIGPGITFGSGVTFASTEAARTSEDPGLEVVECDVPILGQRAARLVFDGTSRHWSSIHKLATFGVDADAKCKPTPWGFTVRECYSDHDAPGVNCACGFYAVPCDIEPWVESGDLVTLLVELSGTVIEHEKGYRASHQRVMECRVPPCRFCGDVASMVDVRDNVMVSACCDAHVPKADGQVLVTVDDLTKLLPVPVTSATTDRGGTA